MKTWPFTGKGLDQSSQGNANKVIFELEFEGKECILTAHSKYCMFPD